MESIVLDVDDYTASYRAVGCDRWHPSLWQIQAHAKLGWSIVAMGAVFAKDCAHLPNYGASKLNIFEGQVPEGDLHHDKYAMGGYAAIFIEHD